MNSHPWVDKPIVCPKAGSQPLGREAPVTHVTTIANRTTVTPAIVGTEFWDEQGVRHSHTNAYQAAVFQCECGEVWQDRVDDPCPGCEAGG